MRHVEQVRTGVVTSADPDIHQGGSRGIGRVGQMRAAGQPEEQPGFDGANVQISPASFNCGHSRIAQAILLALK